MRSARTRAIPLRWLYTSATDTVQFLLLPDIIRFLTRGVARQRWGENIFEKVLHNSLPCLKKGRLFPDPFSGGNPLAL
eukprot:1687576-Rhodomonas_salina.1